MARRVLRITDDLLVHILKGCGSGPPHFFEVIKNPVPEDARILECRTSPYCPNTVEIVIESAQFTDDDMAELCPEFRTVYPEKF